MVNGNLELTLAISFVELVIITLPIWLAGIKYFMTEFEEDPKTERHFIQIVVLIFVSLAAVLVSSGVVIAAVENTYLKASIYGVWLLFFTTGAISFYLLRNRVDGRYAKWFLSGGILVAVVFLIASFLLMMTARL